MYHAGAGWCLLGKARQMYVGDVGDADMLAAGYCCCFGSVSALRERALDLVADVGMGGSD